MEKPDVSGILDKVKSGAGDLAEKARIRTAEAAGSVKETADEIIKTAWEKGSKKTDAREDLQNAEEAGKAVKGKKQRKEDEPEIRLNDVLRTAIDGYNDVFGDTYEYLMSIYASNAGKSGGEFFTLRMSPNSCPGSPLRERWK